MRLSKIKGAGGKTHLELSEGACVVRIYTSNQVKNGKTYRTHFLVSEEGGVKQRKGFADLDDAKAEAQLLLTRLVNGETKARGMSAVDLQGVALAMAEVAPLQITLLEAAKEYRLVKDRLGSKGTLGEAIDYFLKHARPEIPAKTVPEIRDEILLAKKADGLSDAYLRDLKLRLKVFSKAFSGNIAEIDTKQIEAWLRGLKSGPKNRNNYASAVTTLFNFAKRCGYLPNDRATVADDLSRAREVRGETEIYTLDEVKTLLWRVRELRPEYLPYVVIGLFAGIRPAEILRLDWKEVDFESGLIEVKAINAKTAGRRHVPISANLRAWLEPHKKEGPVCAEPNVQTLLKGVVEPPAESDGKLEPGVKWKSNALRHSYGSYRLPVLKNANELALEMGNSPAMIFRHYRELVKPAEAEKFWAIMPPVEAS
jgi:integrase